MLKKVKIDRISFFILIILLILRIPLLFASASGLIDEMVAMVLFLFGTFFFTGVFICKNIDSLNNFCISKVAIVLFLVSPLLSLLTNPYDTTAFIKIPMSIGFAVYLYLKRAKLCTVQTDKKLIFSNILFVIGISAYLVILGAYIDGFKGVLGSENNVTAMWIIESIIFQLSFAAIMEEPLFRGILWGYLRKLGFTEIWVCIVQALIFWLAHIYYIDTGLNFWIFHPLAALCLGFIILKTKSITYSMFAHSLINTFGDIFRHFIKLF